MLDIKPSDCVLIFGEDGSLSVQMPQLEEDAEVPQYLLLATAAGMAARDPQMQEVLFNWLVMQSGGANPENP